MMNNFLKELILEKATFLIEFDLHDLCWKKEDALDLIKKLKDEDVGIYGGDVYILENKNLIVPGDNWYCEPKKDVWGQA